MAEEEIDGEPADPEFLFALMGAFNENSYEEDLERFPSYFDENGWPLFGEFDPYALVHPITGRPWYESPRVPGIIETNPDYDDWFLLAQTYISTDIQLVEKLRARPIVKKEDPGGANALYRVKSHFAVEGNWAYLKEHVRPRLLQLFETRQSSPEFAELWGEYRAIADRLGVSVELARQRESGRTAGGNSDGRDAQRKWYLHWRRYQAEELGQSVVKSNRAFLDVCWRIVQGELEPPEGFAKDWFEHALGSEEDKDGEVECLRQLPNALKRVAADRANMEALLSSGAEEDPKIPSIDPNSYK